MGVSCPDQHPGSPPGRLPAVQGIARRKALGQITSLFVRKVLALADEQVDKVALLRQLGLDPEPGEGPPPMIPAAEYYGFLERLAHQDPDPITLPLRVGAAMRCDDYGAFGLAWKSATNLRGSFARAERYARVLTSVSTYQVETVDEGAYLHLHREGSRRLGLRLSNEATIASLMSISRQVSTLEFQPLAVYFKHPSPGSTQAHEQYFRCPVHFSSPRDALLVGSETLQAPNRLGDPSISRFFQSHLDSEISEMEAQVPLESQSLDRQVLAHVSRALSQGVPRISQVAGQVCMSPRTLQRRLSEGGYTFQTLVDEARRQLSTRLLAETDYSLSEVSFMAGFADQSALTRAFRRWEGQTPRSYRLRARAPSD